MKKLLLDTGAWVAIEDGGDSRHEDALRFKEAVAGEYLLFTTDYILDETFTLLLVDCGHDSVLTFKRGIDLMRRGGILRVVPIMQSLFDDAWDVFVRFNSDKQWSFTDCTTYTVMKQMGITEVFAFDRHFDQMGFIRRPRI